jgi:hypothetical protein
MAHSLASQSSVFVDVAIAASTAENVITVPPGMLLKAVLIPAGWETSTLTLKCSEDGASYFFLRNLSDSNLVVYGAASANWEVASQNESKATAGFPHLLFRLSANQTSPRTLRVMFVTPSSH